MDCDMTNAIRSRLESDWLPKLAALNGCLWEAKAVKEYLEVLQNEQNWNTLSFCLRRHIYLHFTKRRSSADPIPYEVTFEGKHYQFSPVTQEDISGQEKEDYADLMYRMTVKSQCFYWDENGTLNPKKVIIRKAQYLNFLNAGRAYRRNLFPMSVALGFDASDMEEFMNVLGESPAYNFRDGRECVYYFCHLCPELNNGKTVAELISKYEKFHDAAEPRYPTGNDTTRHLRSEIEDIAYDEFSTTEERKEAFLSFLQENAGSFTGYSKSARKFLTLELTTKRLVDICPRRRGGEQWTDILFAPPEENTPERTDTPEHMGRQIFADLFDVERLRNVELERRMTANLTDGAHLRSALFDENAPGENRRKTRREHVTKKDFLLTRLWKLNALIGTLDARLQKLGKANLTEKERMELIRRFQSSTDQLLDAVGLPPIYPANPLDNTVMCALCAEDPAHFSQTLYHLAAAEEDLEDDDWDDEN